MTDPNETGIDVARSPPKDGSRSRRRGPVRPRWRGWREGRVDVTAPARAEVPGT